MRHKLGITVPSWNTMLDIIESLEKKRGKPVVTSNSASMWKMMRLVGDKSAVPGAGRLFQEHCPR